MEFLYKEEGRFRPSWGGEMVAKRSYVWDYSEKEDNIGGLVYERNGRGRDKGEGEGLFFSSVGGYP